MSTEAAEHRARATRILANPKLRERERWIALWNYFLSAELDGGSQFVRAEPEGNAYIVTGLTREAMRLDRPGRGSDRWHAYFQTIYGFGEREKIAKFMYDAIRSYAIVNGSKVALRRFAVYKLDEQTAYLSDYDGRMYKIEGEDEITVESQGEDGVFFADDEGGIHVEPIIGNHGILIDRLANPNFAADTPAGITPEQQRMALIIWMFAVAFPDLMLTKPILLVEGVKGSGKTTAITLLQLVLLGAARPIILQRKKEEDFGVVLLRSPIALLDNLDNFIDWLPDAICSYATSGIWSKRKLFTDDDSAIIKPHAFIAVSTRNPSSFRRDDVIDRCILLRVERRKSFTKESDLHQEIINDRPRLLGEFLWYVGRIISELRAGALADPSDETHRMADFAAFGRAVGRVMDWSNEAVTELMKALQAERDAFLHEEDPLVDILHEWLRYTYRVGSKTNIGRTISVFDLHSELEAIAQSKALPWKESPRTLGLKMKAPHIEREFTIEHHMVGGHRAFRLWRSSDPRLVLVTDKDSGIVIDDG